MRQAAMISPGRQVLAVRHSACMSELIRCLLRNPNSRWDRGNNVLLTDALTTQRGRSCLQLVNRKFSMAVRSVHPADETMGSWCLLRHRRLDEDVIPSPGVPRVQGPWKMCFGCKGSIPGAQVKESVDTLTH